MLSSRDHFVSTFYFITLIRSRENYASKFDTPADNIEIKQIIIAQRLKVGFRIKFHMHAHSSCRTIEIIKHSGNDLNTQEHSLAHY